ncbi:hypothetical protein NicSoilB8_32440 [Arthrobacter sp. NicSoilB8]|nr:hypothetical protein NicSoilB8_32440 [Arthrobacter sp. NicSoilB8]
MFRSAHMAGTATAAIKSPTSTAAAETKVRKGFLGGRWDASHPMAGPGMAIKSAPGGRAMDRVERDNFRLPAGPPRRGADRRESPSHKGTQQRKRTHMHRARHKALHEALSAAEPPRA